MKIVSLLYPTVKCHGEAEQFLGKEVKGNSETKMFKKLPTVTDEGVENMPQPEKGTMFLVNAYVFNALKGREDLVMFNDKLSKRDDNGQVLSQGGVLFS